MSFSFTADHVIVAGIAFLLGMLITVFAYGGTRRRVAELRERVRALELDIDVREAERVRLQRELASSQDQIRPLSDEVDRLRLERDRRKASVVEPAVTAPVTDTRVVASVVPTTDSASAVSLTAGGDDNLTMMKGVGERFAAKLGELGVTRFRQIADWTPAEEEAIDAQLGSFRGRLARDRVGEQARLLADGRITEFEARFGKLGEV